MTPLFKKLNYKEGLTVFTFNHPQSFDAELEAMQSGAAVEKNDKSNKPIDFAIAFATRQEEVDQLAEKICPRLNGDAIFWFCYPKGSSKKYTCNFNRDTGWAVLGRLGMEGVRQVAVDEDWSALRFRKAQYIKTLTRRESYALSAEGKQRAGKR
jgi:hypothetical protein